MGTAGGVDRTSRPPLSSVTIAGGLAVHILFMPCCTRGFALAECEEAEVMQRALSEGAGEGWLDNSERILQCDQTGKGWGKCLLLWFGK